MFIRIKYRFVSWVESCRCQGTARFALTCRQTNRGMNRLALLGGSRSSQFNGRTLRVHELEVRQGELLLQQFGELLFNWLCPLAHQHNELVNSPCYSTTFALLDVRCLM